MTLSHRLDLDTTGRIVAHTGLGVLYADPWPTPSGWVGAFHEPARGMVLHTEAQTEALTRSQFQDPSLAKSAFASVGIDGRIFQYGPVGHGWAAWTQAAGNTAWRGVEFTDNGDPSIPLTAAQVETAAELFELFGRQDRFPIQSTDDALTGRGLILHSDGGVPWGDHPECPGAVRAAQRGAIVARAQAIHQGASMSLLLIDESSYQDGTAPDFAKAKAAGVRGVFIKATEGTGYTNLYAGRDSKAAQAAGIEVGYYHFGHAAQSAAAQVNHFLAVVGTCAPPTLRHVLDHEVTDGLPPAEVAAFAHAFEEGVHARTGFVPILYTYPAFANAGNCAGLGAYSLWLANPSHSPIPAPWTAAVLVQTGQGSVAGFGSQVDLDSTNDLGPLLLTTPHAQVVTPPQPSPAPHPTSDPQEEPMTIVASTAPGQPTFAVIGALVFPIGDGHDVDQMTAAGAKVVHFDPGTFAAFRHRASV